MDQTAIWQFWGPLLTIAIVFAVRLRRAGSVRPLHVRRMWIAPLLITLIVGAMFLSVPPPLSGWLALAGGVLAGAALGWRRGKLNSIYHEPDGRLMHRVSPLAVLLLLGLMILRFIILRGLGGDPAQPHPVMAAVIATDALMGLAVGTVVFTRVEMYLRAKALLRSAM